MARRCLMRVAIHEGEELLGFADLAASDPSMGVASGRFHPSPAYRADEHANLIDGVYVGDRGNKLRVTSEGFGHIECHTIGIGDWPALGEIHVDLFGIISPAYADLQLPDFES